ncbi:MAG: hypothetical protein ABEK01_05100 [Candidatus Nanohaloarchaea archaeon]
MIEVSVECDECGEETDLAVGEDISHHIPTVTCDSCGHDIDAGDRCLVCESGKDCPAS